MAVRPFVSTSFSFISVHLVSFRFVRLTLDHKSQDDLVNLVNLVNSTGLLRLNGNWLNQIMESMKPRITLGSQVRALSKSSDWISECVPQSKHHCPKLSNWQFVWPLVALVKDLNKRVFKLFAVLLEVSGSHRIAFRFQWILYFYKLILLNCFE